MNSSNYLEAVYKSKFFVFFFFVAATALSFT